MTKDDEEKLLRTVALQNASSIRIVRQHAEQRSEFYLGEGQRLAHIGSWAFNPAGFFDYWSAELFRIYGLDPAKGAPTLTEYLRSVHPQDREFLAGTIERMLLDRSRCDVKQRILRPDGEMRHVRWVGVPALEDGVFRGFVGTAMDVTEQEHLTQELRRREAYLTDAQRLSHTGSFGWRVSSGEIFWSEETFRIFEYDPKTKPTVELLLQRVHPEDVALVKQTFERASQDGKDFDFQHRLLMPDHSVKHVRVVAHTEKDVSSEFEFVGAVMDVTERKRAEMLLGGEKRLLEMIARGDSRALILDALCRLVEELAGGSLPSILLLDPNTNRLRHGAAPSLPINYTAAIDGIVIGPSVGSCGTAAYRAERVIVSDIATDPLWAKYRDLALGNGLRACWSTPIISSGGNVLGTFAIYYRQPRSPTPLEQNLISQITHLASIAVEREQAEENLRQSEAYLREAQRLGRMGCCAHNLASGVFFASPELLRMFGRDPEEAKPSEEMFRERIHPEDRPFMEEIAKKGRNEKSDFESDHRIVLPDGSIKHVHHEAHPVFDESGDVVEYIGLIMDVTERKRAEEALRQAQAELAHVSRVTTMGELTASIAHEVNQPLTAVLNNANACLDLLAKGAPNVEQVREALAEIIDDTDRAGAVIMRVRQLAKRAPIEKSLLDLRDVVTDVLGLARHETASRRITIHINLPQELPLVLGDRVQLQQVLLNLVVNGMDAMETIEESKRVLLICGRPETRPGVLLSVQDSGTGFKLEEMDRLFEAFYTTKPQGMGMGLAISRSIIEAHGGRLWAEPNERCGATFLFILPAAEIAKS